MTDALFKKVDYKIGKLLNDIEMGEIGLPDIQRPFVWSAAKVRDLFDSIYRGYPVGFLLFWESGGDKSGMRRIGEEGKQKTPHLLIVDGQQRLTALYAVMKGKNVLDQYYRPFQIKIAFNPLREKFEVRNPAIERNDEWISDVSVLWESSSAAYNIINSYLQKLKSRKALSSAEEEQAISSIQKLARISEFSITALEISADVDEEEVAEIFVRINSKGKNLNQADFILTLMSVFWDEGRKRLEKFSFEAGQIPQGNTPSPYNYYIQPRPDQLLRVIVAAAFRRARLRNVYSLLRGKDLKTEKFSPESREAQFRKLAQALDYSLDLQNWHEYYKTLRHAGYVSGNMISSEVAILFTYALWLIGKKDFSLDHSSLRAIMARWFFMVTLTGRYTGSPESQMEQDLALLRGLNTGEEFVRALEQQIAQVFTDDYWNVTLPGELESAASRSVGQFAFFASLCLHEATVLYSRLKVAELLNPALQAKKAALERHHLFPRKYLQKIGIQEDRLINQIANYALVEWSDNISISDKPPSEYVPYMESRFSAEELREMYAWHALPESWHRKTYADFLTQRRILMAHVIRDGYLCLQKHSKSVEAMEHG